MVGIFALTWLTTRVLSKRLTVGGQTRHLQIIEKMPLGRDKQLALIKVGNRHFLIGLSGQQISFSPGFQLQEETHDH